MLTLQKRCFSAGYARWLEMYFDGIVAGLERQGQKKIAKKKRRCEVVVYDVDIERFVS
jgi:hypothetical protein